MNLGLITYNKKHRKTQEVLRGLRKRNFKNITLLISNFKKIKKRQILFSHRPKQFIGLDHLSLKKKYDLKLKKLNKRNIKDLDKILVCGSGLLPKELLVKNNKIINCHSGLIPLSRGLDSFKWAIKNLFKIGNTLHYIDENVDLGKIISHKVTKLYAKDTLTSFAKRHYYNEINMLINFDKYIRISNKINLKKKKSSKRMPIKFEKNLEEYFLIYKKKFLNKYV